MESNTTDFQRAHSELIQNGYAVINITSAENMSDAELTETATQAVSEFGILIKIFGDNEGWWRQVGVDTNRPLNRSRGTGHLPLHIDFVNTEFPPQLNALLAIRPDPLGGGDSLVVNTDNLESALTEEEMVVLSEHRFNEGVVQNLLNVGADASPFAVHNPHSEFRWRYSGHLLNKPADAVTAEALASVARELEKRQAVIPLKRGQLLITDQRRALHGRLPLGDDQESLPSNERRLMLLAFAKTK